MNDVVWLPSLLVLGIGLAIGLAASAIVRRGRKRKSGQAGRKLRLRDLEARRDDLYRRLRSPDLNAGDRESLELAAAHTLRELDRLAPASTKSERPHAQPSTADAPAAAQQRVGSRHPVLLGFVAGMAVVLLVGMLVYLAVRDSGATSATAPAPTTGSADLPHPTSDTLPPEAQRELARLEAAAAAAPDDLLAHKRLALARLDAGLFFEAFADAEAILANRPEDPDGLFIQGVVQLSMGRPEAALGLLDRVIVRYPEHLRAMIYRGLALAQSGEMDQAISTWEMALEMAGGSHPDLERLLEQAQAQGQPPPAATPPPAPAPPSSAPAPARPASTAAAFGISIELAPGVAVRPASVLFVFLRPGETGPPVAVKRVESPRFPLELTLGADDAMMAGAGLPEQGVLVARLSATGSATRGPDDLEASTTAAVGQQVQLILGGS
jgi:tetratricopeptide (TPR) repeat protein